MGRVDNGLTLEGLAERLGALEHENARLRDEVAAFRGSDTGRDGVGGVLRTPSASRAENGAEDGGSQATEVPEARMDRRRLLKGAAAAAASLVVAGSLTQRDIREAKADDRISVTYDYDNGGAIEGFNNLGYGVWGSGAKQGVRGHSSNGYGVYGLGRAQGSTGVVGESSSGGGHGVSGINTSESGGNGVVGEGRGDGVGVRGSNTTDGSGVGVKGEGGTGVRGEGSAFGVWGESSSGYGGSFRGPKAQVKLWPNATPGRPTTGAHQTGELYMSANAELFICTRAGNSGTWRKVQTIPA